MFCTVRPRPPGGGSQGVLLGGKEATAAKPRGRRGEARGEEGEQRGPWEGLWRLLQ